MAMSDDNPNVWRDGLGRWHASVPFTNSVQRDSSAARALIREAASEYYGAEYNGWTPRITRERITLHGTVVYGER